MRRRGVVFLVFVAAMAGCTENTGNRAAPGRDASVRTQSARIVDDATGPAAPIPDAKPGGTITVLYLADFEHLDPAQNYVTHQQVTANMFLRTLTAFREQGDGTFDLVGDLATNTGVTTDGGQTWTYTLRDGVKFEDGRPITSRDIAYGIGS